MKKANNPSAAETSTKSSSGMSDQDISDAYIYLLGRLLNSSGWMGEASNCSLQPFNDSTNLRLTTRN